MSSPLLLSVLDQSPIAEGSTGAQALRNTIDLARLCDELGYHRYLGRRAPRRADARGTQPRGVDRPDPPLRQSRIRVGSGGVMLPHYSPFKVAETFSLLAGLFPGRIDLALGRAAGTDPLTTFALQRDRRQAAPDDFPQQLAELLAYLDDRMPADHPFARLAATLPGGRSRPSGGCSGPPSRVRSGRAELAMPYAFADFINSGGAEIARV